MILLQLSSGRGPVECCKGVGLALKVIEKECRESEVSLTLVEAIPTDIKGCFKSVLLQLASNDNRASRLAGSWQGAILWVCQSQYRPKHKRKNWYFTGQVYEFDDVRLDQHIVFQSCRAPGAGGQHVNTTDSAVRAVHKETGISVRVHSERSQHANKRLAKALLFQKLEARKQEHMEKQQHVRWQQHCDIQRGNPVKTFKGEKFLLVRE